MLLSTLLNFSKKGKADPLANSPDLICLCNKIKDLNDYEWPNLKLNQGNFVVFDTETTGLYSRKGDEIISIAGILIQGGEISDVYFSELVNPKRKIPKAITEMTGINNEMVSNASDILFVLNNFFEFSGFSVLVAHTAKFDRSFINAKTLKYCGNNLKIPILDTFSLSYILYPDLKVRTLEQLAMIYNISLNGRHSALGDSYITGNVFLHMIRDLNRLGIRTTSQLIAENIY